MKARSKTGGRVAGVPNKLTFQLREQLNAVLSDELEQLPSTLAAIKDPIAKANIVLSLLKLSLPAVRPVFDWQADRQLLDTDVALETTTRKVGEARSDNETARMLRF